MYDFLAWILTVLAVIIWTSIFVVVVAVAVLYLVGGAFWALEHVVVWSSDQLRRVRQKYHNPLKAHLKQLKKLEQEVQEALELYPGNKQLLRLQHRVTVDIDKYTDTGENLIVSQLAAEAITGKLTLVEASADDKISAERAALHELQAPGL